MVDTYEGRKASWRKGVCNNYVTFFSVLFDPSPLSQVVTLLTTPSENYVTLIQPPKHEKNARSFMRPVASFVR